jgi:hypothetical protein
MADASPAGSGAPGTRHCASIVASRAEARENIRGAVLRRTRFAAFDTPGWRTCCCRGSPDLARKDGA